MSATGTLPIFEGTPRAGEGGWAWIARAETAETANTQQLLLGILDQLKSMQRDTMFDEFSLLRFVAGVAQIGVFVCLLISVWFLLSPERPFDAIFTTLGYAVVLQVMCLTLTMQGRR